MDDVMQGPAVPRDEAKINRRRTAAIGEADRVLVELWHSLQSHKNGGEQIDGERAEELLDQISHARGEIAEWRPESN